MHPARHQLLGLHGQRIASAEPTPPTRDAPSRGGGIDRICVASPRTILVVDDNDRHLDILSTILSSVGHDVETCGSGAEALRRLDSRRYDVAILDFVMPEISGAAVAEQMREGLLNHDTPVIVCTANVIIARRKMAEVSGVASIIAKPIDTASLILAVARASSRERRAETVRH